MRNLAFRRLTAFAAFAALSLASSVEAAASPDPNVSVDRGQDSAAGEFAAPPGDGVAGPFEPAPAPSTVRILPGAFVYCSCRPVEQGEVLEIVTVLRTGALFRERLSDHEPGRCQAARRARAECAR